MLQFSAIPLKCVCAGACESVCLSVCMKRSEVVKYLYQFFDAGPPTDLGLTVQARLPLSASSSA